MIDMAKKRPKPAPGTDRHKNAVIAFRPDEPLREALRRAADADQRSMAHIVEILVQEALTARGEWPPAVDADA
jgi:hypothetical protein